MIPTGASVRPLPRRRGPRGVRQVEVSPGRWMDEAVAEAQGIPLVYPLPSNGSGPVTVRHTAPEVPMPAPIAAPHPPASGTGRPHSENQERAWLAVTERGLYWPDVARELGTTSWAVKNMLASYMRRNGIPGEPPGRTPKDETTRRSAVAHGQSPKGSTPARANGRETPADAFAGAPSEPLVLAPEGHPWAADPEPIDLPAAGPQESGVTSDPAECKKTPGPLAYAKPDPLPVAAPDVVKPAADHAETIPIAEPRTGGGGRGDPDDFLARLERELDRLARTDAKLVEEERSVARQRAELATRIERLRTAGEVYRAVMAGRAA